MIAKYIIERAQYHAIQKIDTVTGYAMLNEALREVADKCSSARIPDEIEITAVKDTWCELPNNLISVDAVYDSKDNEVNNYKLDILRIKFKDDDVYKIEYKRLPNEIARGLESTVPEIHELFHNKLEYYIAARVRLNFNHEDGEGMRLLAEFYDGIRSVNDTLSRGKKKRNIKAPLWR